MVSLGNQLDLTVGDYLEHLADDPEILGQFSTEEMTGRFLDLTAQHQAFINLKNAKAASVTPGISMRSLSRHAEMRPAPDIHGNYLNISCHINFRKF